MQVSVLTTGPPPALALSLSLFQTTILTSVCPPPHHDQPPLCAASPGRMTSGKPSFRVSARARLNTAWFSRLICSSSPRSSCREMMSPGGGGGTGDKERRRVKGGAEEYLQDISQRVEEEKRERRRGGTTIWNYATRQRKCRQ